MKENTELFVYQKILSLFKVVAHEEKAFLEAFEKIKEKNPNLNIPELVIIVIQRQSNYRIAPINPDPRAKPPDQNVRPGTCVDSNIMNPTVSEFLLVASKAIQVRLY